jgi:hypothetical protein
MKYLILMQVDPAVLEALTPEQQETIGSGHQAFIEQTTASGEMLSTHALGDPSQSTTVRGTGGKPEVIDGSFAETKVFLGGYYLFDDVYLESAIVLAHLILVAGIEGLALEIRPVMFSAGANM